jgi:hypothetical protein
MGLKNGGNSFMKTFEKGGLSSGDFVDESSAYLMQNPCQKRA